VGLGIKSPQCSALRRPICSFPFCDSLPLFLLARSLICSHRHDFFLVLMFNTCGRYALVALFRYVLFPLFLIFHLRFFPSHHQLSVRVSPAGINVPRLSHYLCQGKALSMHPRPFVSLMFFFSCCPFRLFPSCLVAFLPYDEAANSRHRRSFFSPLLFLPRFFFSL